jgi:DNA polymerase elongation subunit (family B)
MQKKPKIILFDLEVSWGLDASTGAILCVGYKELGSKKISCIAQTDFPGWQKDVYNDEPVCRAIYEILKDADGYITHFGTFFDIPYLNTRLLKWGLPELPPCPHQDTWFIAKKRLKMDRRRLDNLAKFLGVETKDHIGIEAWQQIMNRCKKSWRRMIKYCKQDINVLEQVFEKLRGRATKLPNYALFSGEEMPICPNCGTSNVQKHGFYRTRTQKWQRFLCSDCGCSSKKPHKGILR